MIQIIKANLKDLNLIIPLFHEYRSFYRHQPDQMAEIFLKERLEKDESVIYLAVENNVPMGFVQLYPSFTSRGLGRTWILNDLYIHPMHRRKKLAWKLIEKTIEHARETKAVSVTLSTEIANTNAQDLYKKFGFKKDNDFFHFAYKV